jgi:hypothetical protein
MGVVPVNTAVETLPVPWIRFSQCVGVDGAINRIVEGRVNCPHIGQEFGSLGRNRIGYIDDVLIAHLERGCQEVAVA